MKSRITRLRDISQSPRGGYAYRRLVSQDEQPYNFLQIEVAGTHASRRVVHGIRNYYVVSGQGIFTVEGEEFSVEAGALIVIHPGEVYSYSGEMELLEFNIPTDGKIAHEDVP